MKDGILIVIINRIVMEHQEKSMKEDCSSCQGHGSCWSKMCFCGGNRRFCLLRIVIGILIVIGVFSAGVKVGEFKDEFLRGSYSGMMGERDGWGGYPRQMMRVRGSDPNYDTTPSAGTTAPGSGATTPSVQ